MSTVSVNINSCTMELCRGDITEQSVDAVVNAANKSLAGGGGVDGAIHRVGGPSIMQETRAKYPEGCPTGSAVVTESGALPCRFVIHAVGPVWSGGDSDEPALLASAYRSALKLAVAKECQTVAFPALSAGAYGYPLQQAANTAIKATMDFLKWHRVPDTIRFVLFDDETLEAFRRAVTVLAKL